MVEPPSQIIFLCCSTSVYAGAIVQTLALMELAVSVLLDCTPLTGTLMGPQSQWVVNHSQPVALPLPT
jgi:hypothetical protein